MKSSPSSAKKNEATENRTSFDGSQKKPSSKSGRRLGKLTVTAKHEDKLITILRTAAKLFSEHGYEATSLDMVADRMGMHKATLYHYIEGKEWILLQCLLRSFGDLEEVMQHIQDSSRPALERLRYFVKHLARAQTNDFGKCFAMVGAQPLNRVPGGEIRKFQKRLDSAVRALLTEGMQDGSIRDCNPALTSALLFGAFNWVPRWLSPKSSVTVDDVSDGFWDIIVRGIRSEKGGKPA